jgi:hypothetical protein
MATACSAFLESQDQADLVPDCSTLPTVNCNDASPDTGMVQPLRFLPLHTF